MATMRQVMRLIYTALAATTLVACNSNVTINGGASSGTGGAGTGGGGDAMESACVESTWSCHPTSSEHFSCPSLPEPCSAAVFNDGVATTPSEPPEDPHFENRETAECLLKAFRDGEPAQLRLRVNPSVHWDNTETQIFLLGGARAAAWTVHWVDLGASCVSLPRQIVKPPSYFEQCLQLSSDGDIYDCLSNWSDGCADQQPSCPN